MKFVNIQQEYRVNTSKKKNKMNNIRILKEDVGHNLN